MSLYLKRLVSGRKARYRDNQLNLELDLAYVTDQIIVMGFPAVGVESIYRNHRADVQRFLTAHHGTNFWVFNFCPLRENAYDKSVFEGRVSRYPFPDHHVPPFLYLQLVTREIHSWLSGPGSDTRVAVLHCKAGKGRSGVFACAYLLSHHASPSASVPVSLRDIDGLSDWSLVGKREGHQTLSSDMSTGLPATADRILVRPVSVPFDADLSRVSSELLVYTLEKVLDLHTSRRMKPLHSYPHVPKKSKMGVSIPSQQRWLSYWSQVLTGKGPLALRPFPGEDHSGTREIPRMSQVARVKITKLTIRIHQLSKIQPHLVQAAGVVIASAGKGRAMSESTTGRLWASLARYSDGLVDELERWEKESRSSGGLIQTGPFENDQWDREKMIHSFAQMGISDVHSIQQGESKKPVLTYVLRPLSETEGDRVKLSKPLPNSSHESQLASESSYAFVSHVADDDDEKDSSGILLEANRELRIKLFMGEIAIGWVWLIPAFHISPDCPLSSLVLPRDDIDFANGIGKGLVDMKISFACCAC